MVTQCEPWLFVKKFLRTTAKDFRNAVIKILTINKYYQYSLFAANLIGLSYVTYITHMKCHDFLTKSSSYYNSRMSRGDIFEQPFNEMRIKFLFQTIFHCNVWFIADSLENSFYKVNPVEQSVSCAGGAVQSMTSLPMVPQMLIWQTRSSSQVISLARHQAWCFGFKS